MHTAHIAGHFVGVRGVVNDAERHHDNHGAYHTVVDKAVCQGADMGFFLPRILIAVYAVQQIENRIHRVRRVVGRCIDGHV